MNSRHFCLSNLTVLILSLALIVPVAGAAVNWTESGDAGDLVGTAQTTAGVGSLSNINGSISTMPDHVDMYCIYIPDPAGFYAVLNCAVFTDPDLWLFDENGNGVTMEDYCSGSVIALTPASLGAPGHYYLAISATDDEAQSISGSIWAAGGAAIERAPDGPGAADPLVGWTNSAPLPVAGYTISMLGAETCDSAVAIDEESWGTVKSVYR